VQGILTESPWLRLPLVLAVVLMFQTTLLAEVRPFGASVDLALLLAVCAGAAAGPVRGARAGLIIGFVLDLLLTKPIPFGLSALVFSLAGYAVGLLPDALYEGRWTTRAGVVAAATAAGGVLYAIAATVFGVPNLTLGHVLAVVVVLAVSAFVLAPVFLPLMLWVLMAGDRVRA
jgi:rod shape-determining protein MreD